jgi:flagella basal body P-ring formation protein FlgA
MRRIALVAAFLALVAPTFANASAAPRAEQVVAGATITSIAKAAVLGVVHDTDRVVAPAYTIVDQRVPVGNVVVAIVKAPIVNPGFATVPVAITVDGKLERTITAGFRVTAFVRSAAAARDLEAGTVLSETVGLEALVGRKIRTATFKGTAVYPEATMAVQVVKAGDTVVFIIHDGPVVLSADVVARSSGALGETVFVYNPQTHKALSGLVTGPGKVELTLPGDDT